MRILVAGAVLILAAIGLSPAASAGPVLMPQPGISGGSALVLVRNGCGRGWHRVYWRDRYGRRHSSCKRNW